jgi:hypothetical protein
MYDVVEISAKPAKPLSDESFALELLKTHLTNEGKSGFHCEVNENDPPDIVITWQRGKRWGVEVTRTYQQVEQIGTLKTVSSEDVSARLQRFADELGEELKPILRQNYILALGGPGPFNSWRTSVPFKQWKKETKDLVRKHVESNARGVLRFCGGTLRPSEQKKPWSVMIEYPATELASATTAMLWRALQDKAEDMPRWKGEFAQRWLLLLNFYPLVESTTKLEGTLRRLGRGLDDAHRPNGIFWSGVPHRALIRIPLAKKSWKNRGQS